MRGNWKVRSVEVAGTEFYQVYRLRDLCAPVTEKNVERYGGLWANRAEAVNLAELLNKEGA